MKRLEIFPSGSRPALALDSAVQTLSELGLEPGDYWLGGGAVLAARWGHRQDDSVNLFLETESPVTFMKHILGGDPATMLRKGGAEDVQNGNIWVRWETGHGPVGLFRSHPLFPLLPHLAKQSEARHGIPLERSASILKKKVTGRMKTIGEILDRDLHDMVACARHEPKELVLCLRPLVEAERKTIAAEIRHLDRISPSAPGDAEAAERELRKDAALLFEEGAEAFVKRIRHASPSWEGGLPCRPRSAPPPVRNPGNLPALLPLERFQDPCFQEESPFRPKEFTYIMNKNMAGDPMSPKGEEFRDWIRAERKEDLPPGALAFMSEHLDKLRGIEAMEFRQNCGASLLDIARSAHRARTRSLVFPAWLNRHARRHAGDPLEEVEGYSLLGGWRDTA